MDIEQAYRIVQQYGDYVGIENLFAIIASMELAYNALDTIERTACKIIKQALQQGGL